MPILEYYSDRSEGDFTEVFPAQELKMTTNSATIPIPIINDDICEGNEDFSVYLTEADGGILGFESNSKCYAKVTITDDDGNHFLSVHMTSYSKMYLN